MNNYSYVGKAANIREWVMSVFGMRPNPAEKIDAGHYVCWGCDAKYAEPADFLWHIQFYNGANSYQAAEAIVQEAMVTK